LNRKWIVIAGIVVVVAGLILLRPFDTQSVLELARWAEAAPGLAWPLYLITFILAVVLMLPGWVFMVAGGYLFGSIAGGLLAFIANLAGSIAAFYLAKTYARDWVQDRLASSDRFQGFDEAVERNGFTTILFARLAMLPNNLLNYSCGLTQMRLRDFVLGTSLGCLPILVANVLIGASTMDLFTDMAENGLQAQKPPFGLLMLIIAAVAIILVLKKIVSRRLAKAE